VRDLNSIKKNHCVKQGWWSRLNFNGSGSCSEARFSNFSAPTPELAIFLLWLRLCLLLFSILLTPAALKLRSSFAPN